MNFFIFEHRLERLNPINLVDIAFYLTKVVEIFICLRDKYSYGQKV